MKRQLVPHIAVWLVLILFFSLNASFKVYAQSGTGELPGTKSTSKGAKCGKTAPPTPTPPPPAPVSHTLTIGEETKGRLDPKTSDKGASAGSYFEELILNAKSEDLLTFHLESENPSL